MSVTVVDDGLSQDMVQISGLALLITRSATGMVFSTDVPSPDARHGVNMRKAITTVLSCVELLAPDAVVIQIAACNNHPDAQRTKYVKHWPEEDERNAREILDRLCTRGKEIGETEVMQRLDYTRQRARQVLTGNPKMNIETLMRLARVCGYKLTLGLEEDPDWIPPSTDD